MFLSPTESQASAVLSLDQWCCCEETGLHSHSTCRTRVCPSSVPAVNESTSALGESWSAKLRPPSLLQASVQHHTAKHSHHIICLNSAHTHKNNYLNSESFIFVSILFYLKRRLFTSTSTSMKRALCIACFMSHSSFFLIV